MDVSITKLPLFVVLLRPTCNPQAAIFRWAISCGYERKLPHDAALHKEYYQATRK
jgi:hypothetical protein